MAVVLGMLAVKAAVIVVAAWLAVVVWRSTTRRQLELFFVFGFPLLGVAAYLVLLLLRR
jgi:hypothetical protein